MKRLATLAALAACAFALRGAPVPVAVRTSAPGKFALWRGGAPYFVRGAGGPGDLARLAACGGNSVRTWGGEQLPAALDAAERLGLTVCAGLWIEHERHGFDYDDPAAFRAQVEKHCRVVDRFKDRPALLVWAVGNEVETRNGNPKVWDAIEAVSAYIKRVDPHHPVMTVTAHITATAVAAIKQRCPSVDLLGCNCYAGIAVIARDVRAAGWPGPYLITEWGNDGYWEVPKTAWRAELEPTSTEKAAQRAARYQAILADSDRCLGSYAFLWGEKQEITHTWFNLFADDGGETESVELLHSLWTGQPLTALAPQISPLRINGAAAADSLRVAPRAELRAACALVRGARGDVNVQWELLPESTTKGSGGEAEARPAALPIAPRTQPDSTNLALNLAAPEKPGAYRLFVTVRGPGRTVATANFPFQVTAP